MGLKIKNASLLPAVKSWFILSVIGSLSSIVLLSPILDSENRKQRKFYTYKASLHLPVVPNNEGTGLSKLTASLLHIGNQCRYGFAIVNL